MARPATGETFIARARIPLKTWEAFETHVGEKQRSGWIKDFVEGFVREPKAWLDAKRVADRRGEVLWTVVARALKAYVARNRDLLEDAAEDE